MVRCDHAAFRVADLDRSIAFYQSLLPARLVSRRQHEDRWRTEIATLRPEGHEGFTLVLLMPRRVRWLLRLFRVLVPRQTWSHEHLGFVCDTREELERRQEAARAGGVRIAQGIVRLEDREGWVFEVRDPDGNAVEWTFGSVHD